ncbi:uncharacterized protein B0J16DRAFT_377019 [Fusarium flagelliforme]|nr:uncharacterized protein B0J16DRAFT_377019 [Fusarium flagelliforme]KAH7196559.1 hypothetical protein B0J16DRAFT_377019 [Fusarium flagelliforme]
MSVVSPKVPAAIYLYRQDPNISFEDLRSLATPYTPSKRRSVSSMTGLSPLSLPISRPDTPPILFDEDVIKDMMDCFPEMLARDLERSSPLFASKNMTAGMPSSPVWFTENQISDRSISSPSRIPNSPYQTGSVRVQNLGSIEERQSMVSFLEHRGRQVEEESDEESVSSTESAAGIPIRSVKAREYSIATAATSLTSGSGNPPSPKSLSPVERGHEYSWIDVDSDGDNDEETRPEIRDQLATPKGMAALSPRPPTPPSMESTFDITVMMEAPQPRLHRACSCIDESPKSSLKQHRRQKSAKSLDSPAIPPRVTSLTSATNSLDTTPRLKTPVFDSRISPDNHGYTNPSFSTQRFRDETDNNTILLKSDFGSIELEIEDEDTYMDHYPPPPPLSRPDTVYIEQTPPPSPLPTVESWLDGSNPPLPQIPNDDLVKAVPLPPEIIETLRVSIACFPETMLLSSSLTTETIRSYSKKVRNPSADIWADPTSDSSSSYPRKSIWKKVVSHGRDSSAARRHRLHSYDSNSSSGAVASPIPWAPLRHVFPGCSDYICDALYAHIVAYNYVSRVPRNQPSGKRVSTSDSKSQGENIPKKAASLLGLSAPQVNPTPNVGRFARKFSSPLTAIGFNKEEPSTVTTQDNATRNIESGLLRCISRLIATAKMITENGTAEERIMDAEPQEMDMILVRSLCEIVRLSEEAS